MFLKNVKYILSSPSMEFWPSNDKKEICILGRSNVGKSTFINKITNQKNLAYISKKPGLTQYLNFYDVNNSFYLVDSPGYGYARASVSKDSSFEKMMNEYLSLRKNIVSFIVIVDAKVGFTSDDLLVLDLLKKYNHDVLIVASKSDKLNQSLKAKFLKQAKEVLDEKTFANLTLYSGLNNLNVDLICDKILSLYNM